MAIPSGLQLLWYALPIILAAAVLSAALMVLLRPVLTQYALARPNARSSHRKPTPQGGGIAVVSASVGVFLVCGLALLPSAGENTTQLLQIALATVLIAIVGALDDVRDLRISVRLPLQALSVILVVSALSTDVRVIPQLPLWFERSLLVISGIYFVNIVNFMDGIDWITVAEVVPITFGVAIIGVLGALPWHATLIALTLLGAMVGFAPFNKPVAKVFLGDVGSLPIGLLVGFLLVLVAAAGHLIAAILLPLYYLADATFTLGRRVIARERFWLAHRSHFYQRATNCGFSVIEIDVRIFAVNLVLVLLAVSTVVAQSRAIDVTALILGSCLVAWLLFHFSCSKRIAGSDPADFE